MARLSMNVTTAFQGNVTTDIAIAKAAGFDGVELQTPKVTRYLDVGFTAESIADKLDGFPVSGVGAVLDIERTGEARAGFLAEVTRLSRVAQVIGAPIVQL